MNTLKLSFAAAAIAFAALGSVQAADINDPHEPHEATAGKQPAAPAQTAPTPTRAGEPAKATTTPDSSCGHNKDPYHCKQP